MATDDGAELATEVRRRWWTPTTVHYASLVVGLVAILVIARDQWFFGDDWAILVPRLDDQRMAPHVGHWNLIPAVAFPALRAVFGMHSYLPFLLLALAAHLAVVHLSWRIMRRVGVQPWIATALAGVLLVLGGGAENILWAFQFGFMGAIALGLAVVLLIDQPKPRWAPIIVLAVIAPMFSGTAIPLLAAAGVLGWIRRGSWRTLLLLAPAAAVYLCWYLVVARQAPPSGQGVQGIGDLGAALIYGAVMYAGGLGRAVPFVGLGVIPVLAVVVWVVVVLRRGVRTAAAPALALAAGSVVFVALTAFSRLANGLSSAASERYAYLTIVLLVPAIALVLSWVAARSAIARVVTLAGIVVVAGWSLGALVIGAGHQAEREAVSREVILDYLDRVVADPDDPELLNGMPDPIAAPDLYGSDLLELYGSGALAPPPGD